MPVFEPELPPALVEIRNGQATVTTGNVLIIDWDEVGNSRSYADWVLRQLPDVHPEEATRISRVIRHDVWPDEPDEPEEDVGF